MGHFTHLQKSIPSLSSLSIVDIGAGSGGFLIEAVQAGATPVGIEYNPEHIERAFARAHEKGVNITLTQGAAEKLPFANASFDFANMSELIEHVSDPDQVLHEAYRVLTPGGMAYMSVPNRFGFNDPHFRMRFVNWFPRRIGEKIISFFGKDKDYQNSKSGFQRLSEMHYMTWKQFVERCMAAGFSIQDTREIKIRSMFGPASFLVVPAYRCWRFLFQSTFHVLAQKQNQTID